jgi:hypothetical protein
LCLQAQRTGAAAHAPRAAVAALSITALHSQVKENICKEGFVVDKDDNSLTRSNTYMLELFQQAGMSLQ